MILPIYIYGQPVLRKEAQDITADYENLPELITNMWETLAESGGIGLAAPQIGKAIRVVVIDLDPLADDFPEYKDRSGNRKNNSGVQILGRGCGRRNHAGRG